MTIIIYNISHKSHFRFTWEQKPLQLKHEMILPFDEKALTKKTSMCHDIRRILTAVFSRMWCANKNNQM